MRYIAHYVSPYGKLLLASDGEAITGSWFSEQKHFAAGMGDVAEEKPELAVLQKARDWLDRYFHGENPGIAGLPLAPQGSAFRQAVWEILLEIPYGAVRSYGEIAKEIAGKTGRGLSSQAIGGAVGHNPISILIPCHRVVGASGSLTGYAGGLAKKIRLLEHEGVDVSRFFIPQKGTAL